jgi:hypothetical protein
MTPEERIKLALSIAMGGTIDGAHHKMEVIDEMVRALTGCPLETKTSRDYQGKEYTYEGFGESEEYKTWVAQFDEEDEGEIINGWTDDY